MLQTLCRPRMLPRPKVPPLLPPFPLSQFDCFQVSYGPPLLPCQLNHAVELLILICYNFAHIQTSALCPHLPIVTRTGILMRGRPASQLKHLRSLPLLRLLQQPRLTFFAIRFLSTPVHPCFNLSRYHSAVSVGSSVLVDIESQGCTKSQGSLLIVNNLPLVRLKQLSLLSDCPPEPLVSLFWMAGMGG